MADVKKISLTELFARPEFTALCDAYAEEAGNAEFGLWSIDHTAYLATEENGVGQAFAVFDEGKLVGFAFAILTVQPHFQRVNVLFVDALFVAEEARRTGAGLRLIQALKNHARECKADGLLLGARFNTAAYRLYEAVAKPMNTLFWWQA